MKEVIDVVDAHGNILEKLDRVSIHKKGLLHKLVQVMVFDPDGRLFVQQRALSKDRFAGYWEGSLSGHVQSGESFTQAAERELHEELGVCVSRKSLKKLVRFGFHKEDERVLVMLFVVKDYKAKLKLDKNEIKKGEFWTVKKLELELKGKKLFHPVFLKAWEEFKKSKEGTKDFI